MNFLIQKTQDTINEELDSIHKDIVNWKRAEKKTVLHKLQNHTMLEKDAVEFYKINNIATEEPDGLIVWKPAYINECLNDIYVNLISNRIITELEDFKKFLADQFSDKNDENDLLEFLMSKKKKFLREELNYRRKNGRAISHYLNYLNGDTLKDGKHWEKLLTVNDRNDLLHKRFEVIKDLNTSYGNRLNESRTANYPFFKANGEEFLYFEYQYRFLKVLKKLTEQNSGEIFEKVPFVIDAPIFINNGQDCLYHILLKSGIITYDKQNKSIKKMPEFRGACKALFPKLRTKRKINSSATFISFIEYLNETKGYNAGIPKESKGSIATKPTESNAWSRVEVEFSKIFGE